MNGQSFRSRCAFRSFLGIPGGHERCSAPAPADCGEKSVFYGVELGAIRWIMHHDDVQPCPACKFHEVLLYNFVRAGVGASTVTEYGDGVRFGILFTQIFTPYQLEAVACELGCVMAVSENEIPIVCLRVVDTIWDNLTIGECREVVVIGLGLFFYRAPACCV